MHIIFEYCWWHYGPTGPPSWSTHDIPSMLIVNLIKDNRSWMILNFQWSYMIPSGPWGMNRAAESAQCCCNILRPEKVGRPKKDGFDRNLWSWPWKVVHIAKRTSFERPGSIMRILRWDRDTWMAQVTQMDTPPLCLVQPPIYYSLLSLVPTQFWWSVCSLGRPMTTNRHWTRHRSWIIQLFPQNLWCSLEDHENCRTEVSIKCGYPKWLDYFMENPIKMDDLGVPLFQEITILPRNHRLVD